MALTADLQYAGMNLPTCYIRVENISGSKRNSWKGLVRVYVSEANAKDTTKSEAIREFTVTAPYDKNRMNPIMLIYEAICKLPDFAHAHNS